MHLIKILLFRQFFFKHMRIHARVYNFRFIISELHTWFKLDKRDQVLKARTCDDVCWHTLIHLPYEIFIIMWTCASIRLLWLFGLSTCAEVARMKLQSLSRNENLLEGICRVILTSACHKSINTLARIYAVL